MLLVALATVTAEVADFVSQIEGRSVDPSVNPARFREAQDATSLGPFVVARRWPGSKCWPDQELDRQVRLACPITVLPSFEPEPNLTSLPEQEKRSEHVVRIRRRRHWCRHSQAHPYRPLAASRRDRPLLPAKVENVDPPSSARSGPDDRPVEITVRRLVQSARDVKAAFDRAEAAGPEDVADRPGPQKPPFEPGSSPSGTRLVILTGRTVCITLLIMSLVIIVVGSGLYMR